MAKAQQPQQVQQPSPQDQHVEQMKAMGVPHNKIEEVQRELNQRGLNFGGLIQTLITNLPALLKLLDDLKNAGFGGTETPPQS